MLFASRVSLFQTWKPICSTLTIKHKRSQHSSVFLPAASFNLLFRNWWSGIKIIRKCLIFLKSFFHYTDANAKSLFCFLQGKVIDNHLQVYASWGIEVGVSCCSSIIGLSGASSIVNIYRNSKISFDLQCFYFIAVKQNSGVCKLL